jgi:hypothetical protein
VGSGNSGRWIPEILHVVQQPGHWIEMTLGIYAHVLPGMQQTLPGGSALCSMAEPQSRHPG